MPETIPPLFFLPEVQAVLGLFGTLLYFAPSRIAEKRHHHNSVAIFLTNLLFGWSILGWLVAFIWAFTESRAKRLKGRELANFLQDQWHLSKIPEGLALIGFGLTMTNRLVVVHEWKWGWGFLLFVLGGITTLFEIRPKRKTLDKYLDFEKRRKTELAQFQQELAQIDARLATLGDGIAPSVLTEKRKLRDRREHVVEVIEACQEDLSSDAALYV